MNQQLKILVVYYSQSGQLKQIIDTIVAPFQHKASIVYKLIEPVEPFPFPWKKQQFFDAMPECVLARPRAVKYIGVSADEHFDLVILGYTPWFLSPSQPVAGFLQSEEGKSILKGKRVLTVSGCRNMWLNAQEAIKRYLSAAGATLVGNIALVDKNHNLVSLFTIQRWAFKGKKDGHFILPPAGVQEEDIKACDRFAAPIVAALENNKMDTLQAELVQLGAAEVLPSLVVLENRGTKPFKFFAKFISDKGGPAAPSRQGRVSLYRNLLPIAVIILSPISALSALITLITKKKQLNEEVAYYKGIELRKA
ncbi:hypothetical protein LX64_00635 [Chitinophaga skermanii]|uniref:Dialkylrecorsinol condensing enzyme n=1 Tax=Chitinophaga skermanii TaxID=331697 RepID=A0A327R4N6_9BACT|nr:hypothetical protein [Chitinophaga skermanii]RAJ11028.1 hypothetical protein LX64_00635 [Chitinophaga skermanii]